MNRKCYTGLSRTTKWRNKKRKEGEGCDDEEESPSKRTGNEAENSVEHLSEKGDNESEVEDDNEMASTAVFCYRNETQITMNVVDSQCHHPLTDGSEMLENQLEDSVSVCLSPDCDKNDSNHSCYEGEKIFNHSLCDVTDAACTGEYISKGAHVSPSPSCEKLSLAKLIENVENEDCLTTNSSDTEIQQSTLPTSKSSNDTSRNDVDFESSENDESQPSMASLAKLIENVENEDCLTTNSSDTEIQQSTLPTSKSSNDTSRNDVDFESSENDESQPSMASINSSQSEDSENDSTESDSEFHLESYEAYYLEAGPENQHPQGQGWFGWDDYDNPDDPGDPHDPEPGGVLENHESDDSDDDVLGDVANFVHDNLNVQVNLVDNITKGEIILLELATSVRHNKTFLSTLDNFRNLNLMFGPKCFPENPTKLWSTILLDKAGIECHVYCGRRNDVERPCGAYIGRRDLLGDVAYCECGYQVPTNKARFFVTLNLRNQLKEFLCIPGMWEHLQYPHLRRKVSPDGIEDIYDGAHYQRLKEDGGVLASPYNFSYVFNTDGCSLTKRGSLKMWPVYIRINELPPNLRQKFHFIAAVYIDHVDPNFHSLLKPFVRQANSLSRRGVVWKPDGVNEVTSKFVPLCHCVDSPARYGMLYMSHWNSDFGCTYCTHQGVQAGGNQRYSFLNVEGLPPVVERTHAGMQNDMVTAQLNGRPQRGHKGTGPMLLLEHHNLREGQAVDDLHQDHEGCANDITELLLTVAPRVDRNIANIDLLRSIDNRLLLIKTPSRISRKPRSIKNRSKYNGTEWRNWLVFYSVPCLIGLIHPEYIDLIASLSHGCYLLSQEVINPEDLNTAERLLQRYCTAFEEKFHLERIKFNLHVTASHKVECVRQLGPPWAYSTYNFESLNSKLVKYVTSPKGAAMQVVTRALLNLTVHSAQYDHRVQEQVRERLLEILNKEGLKRVSQVGPHIYLVGKGLERIPTADEVQVLEREGFHLGVMMEYKSVVIGNTRYKSLFGQNPTSKSNDTFIYSSQDTFCTIMKIIQFMDDEGEERHGALVTEHSVARPLPVARHISILQDAATDLLHYLPLDQIRSPAIKMNIGNMVYAVCVPNCFEID